jgi:glycosyltransferase involved in cell wall biosynthesis
MHTIYRQGGGVLTVVRNLAADLAQRHEVEIVSVVRPSEQPAHAVPPGVQVRSLLNTYRGAVNPSLEAFDLPTLLRQPSAFVPVNEPHYSTYSRASDVALEQYIRGVQDGALIGMQPGVNLAVAAFADPRVVRVGQDHRPFQDRRRHLRRAFRANLPRLDAFLTLVDRDIPKYRRILGDDLRIEAMPNAVPAYDGPVSDGTGKIVVAAGQLKRNKGFDRLIDAWSMVAKVHPDWQLHIFGKGAKEEELNQQIRDLGLTANVELKGYSTELMRRFAESSIFVLSSRAEGYAMVILEAMSCGLPVVSFDCPTGPSSMITDGKDGYLVRNGDVAGLAQRIVELIEQGPEGRQKLGSEALLRARSQTQEAISARWESLLEDLARGKQAG